ncbi:hypothetical protein ACHAXR_008243 [Thalassiosira sp. AJA248-18]
MTSHQTIVVEMGASRIKVGFAGESKPRRVLYDGAFNDDGGGGGSWSVGVNDSLISRACNWASFFQYLSSPTVAAIDGAPAAAAATTTTVYEWEKTLYPLFSHILTSILFIQRPSRHRMLLLINDAFPPLRFREALHRVLLDYLSVGGVWLANGGVFEGLHYLMDGLPPTVPTSGRPKAHLLVDIGTYEARVLVSVAGSLILTDTLQTTMSGYHSFLRQVLANYQEMNEKVDENEQSGKVEPESLVATLEDANAVIQASAALSAQSSDMTFDSTTISVNLPSLEHQQQSQTSMEAAIQLPIQPLLQAFHQIYLDYTNSSSLIYAMLTCAMTCPIDYRKVVMQNVILLGGGSVALRHFGAVGSVQLEGKSANTLGLQLEMAAKDACGIYRDENVEESKTEEKKDDSSPDISSIAKQRFQCLRGAVDGHANDDGETIGGINVQYPDPFSADMAAWIGGSIMGTLGHKNYQKKF